MNNIFFCDYINYFSFFLEEERREEAILEAWPIAAVHLSLSTKNKGSKKTTLNEAARDRRDALLHKATKKAFMLLKGGIRPGEELGGLTPNLRV